MKIITWRISTLVILLIFVASFVIAQPITGKTIEISAAETTMVSAACTIPNCNGVRDTGKIDNNGCPTYECPTITTCPFGCNCDGNVVTCPTTPIGSTCTVCVGGTPTGQVDQDNCPIYNCPTIACTVCVGGKGTGQIDSNGCPVYDCPPSIACTSCIGGINTGKLDAKGCPIYDCPTSTACTICVGGKPTGKFDVNGCEIYDCPATPACTACVGGTPSGKVDTNGCPIYDCPATKSCTACVGGVPTGTKDDDGCPIYVCPATTCPSECVCDNGLVTCPTKENKPIEVAIVTPAGVSNVVIEKVSQSSLAIKKGSSVAKTTRKIKVEEKKLLMVTSTGSKEIKVMPDTASEVALNQLKLKEYEIELKDVGKPVYEIQGTKEVRILGFISATMSINSQIDANSGVVLQTNKPWWSFLARS